MTVLDSAWLDDFERQFGPIARSLGRLIRPTIIAPAGQTYVWCDWSAIEARMLPWLANSPGAEKVLDIFRENDKDPSAPDIYRIEAGNIYDKDPREIGKGPERQVGKVACIAEGQLVTTDRGLVPIEKVTLAMRVWDGVSFVSHSGSVFQGVKDVYEYCGLVATADHVVWTEEGRQLRLGDAAACGARLLQSEPGGAALRAGGGSDRRAALHRHELALPLRSDAVHQLHGEAVDVLVEPETWEDTRLPAVQSTAPHTDDAGQTADGREVTLHEPQRSSVATLRGEGDRVQVPEYLGSGAVDPAEHRLRAGEGTGPQGQRRALRTGEPTVGDTLAAGSEPAAIETAGGVDLRSCAVALCGEHGEAAAPQRPDTRRDLFAGARSGARLPQELARYRGKARVYDIVNAGPRHRFAVSGVLVHNCLSLGFGGGEGALGAMATNYGIYLSPEQKTDIVQKWRANNAWAKSFWGGHGRDGSFGLWGAACSAVEEPDTIREAGRVAYVFDRNYLGGTLFCALPGGRLLTYPRAKWEKREVEDKKTGKVTERTQLTFLRAYGRSALWYGKLAENITQAAAGSLLRGKLVQLRKYRQEFPVVGHTHDEIVGRCGEAEAERWEAFLMRLMTTNDVWNEGLPLAAEATTSWYYTKAA